ncbi:MAG: glycosyl hydrolase [Balneolaceae bacterium]
MINSDRKGKFIKIIIGGIAGILFMIPANTAALQAESGLAETFTRPEINSNQKAWTRWWWMGNAVTKEGITIHLEKMADVNIGGVEISPIYGVDGYEDVSVEYLSPEWMEVEEANRMGMQVDMITGTGREYGGKNSMILIWLI